MPDVFDNYFKNLGESIEDYFKIIRLDPSYRVYFSKKHKIDIPANFKDLKKIFEKYEKGSGKKLEEYLKQAKKKYDLGINKLAYKPSKSIFEFLNLEIIAGVMKMDIFNSMHKHIRKFFKNEFLIKIIEFPFLFLGATPKNTSALYSLINYADIKLGTWYPKGGMYNVNRSND